MYYPCIDLSAKDRSKTQQNYLLLCASHWGLILLLLNKPGYVSTNLDLTQKYVDHVTIIKERRLRESKGQTIGLMCQKPDFFSCVNLIRDTHDWKPCLTILNTITAMLLPSEDVKEINPDYNNIYLSIAINIFLRKAFTWQGRDTHIMLRPNLSSLNPNTKPTISKQNAQ